MASRTLEIIVNQTGNAAAGIGALTKGILGVGAIAGGIAVGGVVALGAGITAVANAGLSMNNSMEQASAKINAFTKDADLTAQILEDVREEAAKTPFEFEQMAASVSGLLPAAKQANVGIMDLLRDAEVLAASNPAEGLEGAAFALREAVSGDFTSVIERFNLPRSMINQLKAEGLPALEIVRTAMKEMGYDMDLVSALAATAEGRWSTLKDTFTNFASTITQPVFDFVSSSLGRVNELFTRNEATITAVATAISGLLNSALSALTPQLEALITRFQAWVTQVTPGVIAAINNLQTQFGAWAAYIGSTVIPMVVQMAAEFVQSAIKAIPSIISALTELYQFTTASLLPAFSSIWESLQRIIAVFTEGKESTDVLSAAVAVLKGIMQPTIITVNAIASAFEIVAFAVEIVSQAITDIGELFKSIKSIWDSVWNGMKRGLDMVIGAWESFRDTVKAVVSAIPDILIPGSPTPFEIGLRGIAAGANQAAEGISNMGGASVQIPGGTPANLAAVTPMAGAAGNAAPVVIHLTYAPAVSLADQRQLVEVLKQAVREINRQDKVMTR